MPRRHREEGIVDVVIGPGEQAPKRLEGFDLEKIALSDASLLEPIFRYFRLNPKSQSDRRRLLRMFLKKARRGRGRKSDDLALIVDQIKTGVATNESAPKAARKLLARRDQLARCNQVSEAALIQKIRRHRRKKKPPPRRPKKRLRVIMRGSRINRLILDSY